MTAMPNIPAVPDAVYRRQLLTQAIAKTQLSVRAFATNYLIRDERLVRRMLAGDAPIPDVVLDKIMEVINEE